MTIAADELQLLRARWRRAREAIDLTDPRSDKFGRGGLAAHVEDVGVRFLVLPSDPERSVASFETDFWEWWMEDRPNPFEGAAATDWGIQSTPTAHAAVRYNQRSGKWNWGSYLALHRHGGLEFGLGEEGAAEWGGRQENEVHRVFFLTTIVGRVWVAMSLYADVLARFGDVEGPWEVTLGLLRTKDALLGNVAAGWKDIGDWWPGEPPRCPDPNLLFRAEIDSWPDKDGQREQAFQFGGMIEDAWGVKDRRWLISPQHPDGGTFDVSRYR